eukprot:441820_1
MSLNEKLLEAAKSGNISLCIDLINKGADPSKQIGGKGRCQNQVTALHRIIEQIKKQTTTFNNKKSSSLHIINILQLFLSKNADINTIFYNGYHFNGSNIETTAFEMILNWFNKYQDTIDTNNYKKMNKNIKVLRNDILNIFLNNKYCKLDLSTLCSRYWRGGNSYSSWEFSSLHTAVRQKDYKIVKMILENAINININELYKLVSNSGICDDVTETPLYIAVKQNNYKMVKLLLTENSYIHNCDVNVVCKYFQVDRNSEIRFYGGDDGLVFNMTALHLGIKQNDLKIVKLLIIHGGNVNKKVKCWKVEKYDPFFNSMGGDIIFEENNAKKISCLELVESYLKLEEDKIVMKNVLGNIWFSDMIEEYPLDKKEKIKAMIDLFNNTLKIPDVIIAVIITYFLNIV